ncbi:methyltransferase [Candidatus Kaiserbacteria bacterium]|nr:methyltransferase [Candidatus Kaiserbacteria bacterium]
MNQEERWLLEEKYEGVKTLEFLDDCKRLAAGEPLGYVIGYVPFLGCKIWLDSHPLIPRPETEFWVEKAIKEIVRIDKANQADFLKPPQKFEKLRGLAEKNPPDSIKSPIKVLDLCAGSGAIGLAVAKHVPMVRIDFSEIDAHHLPTIGKNLKENNIDCTRYRVWQSDLFNDLPTQNSDSSKAVISDEIQGTGKFLQDSYQAYSEKKIGTRNEEGRRNHSFLYDFILTNPPYIDPTLDRTEASVKNFEPHQALYGGQNGTEFIEQIIATAPTFLNKNGQLWIEHEPEQTEIIHKLAKQLKFSTTTEKDQYDIERYSILVLQ